MAFESQDGKAAKKRIFINAFDMFTVGHLSFGQWRNPDDKSATKRRDLSYWTDLAKLLEEGDINAIFLADTFGQYDVYKGTAEPAVRTAAQYPMGDPAIPISAMAAVTKNLGFAITTSTSYEAPYVVAKRFSTLDHLTQGRFGWNIVTSWKQSATKAVGLPYVDHDRRYEIADEFVRVLYKLWEGSWANNALVEDREKEIYADYNRIRTIHHHGQSFNVDAPHILDPSPQRTPFLFQAGTSPAGIHFGATHAEGIFVSAPSPHILAPRVKAIRDKAAELGRNPQSIKVFAILTPIIGKTTEEANEKYQTALKYASHEAGLAFFSGGSGIDLSKYDLDKELVPSDSTVDSKVHSLVASLTYSGKDVPLWTPRNIGKQISIGGNGPVPVGTAEEVADIIEEWIEIADLDGFNVGYVLTPGSFEDLVHLLVPELRKRGRYAPRGESGTMRERIYGPGQSKLRDDHTGSQYKYENYKADPQGE
ncbi:xenobiotic compound family [Phlyctema vagabunda]|uniref:Xenobiotic compound family n=1 Tax=Phlyctema vagabunda TaxID=108571 RepID=A0ABR4PQ65_9HELO